jgi:hypothetical protein
MPPPMISGSLVPPSPAGWAALRRRMQKSAAPSSAAEIKSRLTVPRGTASTTVTAGPAMVPRVPPAAMNPNRRRPRSLPKMSAIKLQKTETTNKLKTLVQMKKARAQMIFPGTKPSRTQKPTMLRIKNQ